MITEYGCSVSRLNEEYKNSYLKVENISVHQNEQCKKSSKVWYVMGTTSLKYVSEALVERRVYLHCLTWYKCWKNTRGVFFYYLFTFIRLVCLSLVIVVATIVSLTPSPRKRSFVFILVPRKRYCRVLA